MKKNWKKYKISKILKPVKNSIAVESKIKPLLQEQKRIVKIIKSVEAKQQKINELNKEQEREIKNTLYSTYIDIIKDAEYKPMVEVAPLNRRKVEVVPNTTYQEIGVRSFG